jgi:hypothetical protein
MGHAQDEKAKQDAKRYKNFPGALFLSIADINLNDARVLFKHVSDAGFKTLAYPKPGSPPEAFNRYALLANAAQDQAGGASGQGELGQEPGVVQAGVTSESFNEDDPAYVPKPAVYAAIAKYIEWDKASNNPPLLGINRPTGGHGHRHG